MFRLQDNVPEPYIKQSRDFQLFCRVYDYTNNAVRFDIDSMPNVLDPMAARNNVLKLLAAKVGFFPTRDLDDTMMRYIISTFPHVIKLKGTRLGITKCIDTVLRARNISAQYSVNINNEDHTIDIAIKSDFDRVALEEYLQYIIPPGYVTTMSIAQGMEAATALDQVNIVYTYVDPNSSISQVTDNKNFILPTYFVRVVTQNDKPVVYSSPGTPIIDVYTKGEDELAEPLEGVDWDDLPNGSTVTVWHYFEKDDGLIHQKILTLVLPANDTNRDFGTITRSEIIGSDNDATYKSQFTYYSNLTETEANYDLGENNQRKKWGEDGNTIDSTTGKDTSDLPEKWLEPVGNVNVHLAGVFNDLMEQANNDLLILRVIDKTQLYLFKDEKPYVEEEFANTSLEDGVGIVKLDRIDIPDGIKLETFENSEIPPYILDNYSTIASMRSIKTIDGSKTKYLEYHIETIGIAPTDAVEDDSENNGDNNEGD